MNNIGEISQRPKNPTVAVLETVHARARESRIENINTDSSIREQHSTNVGNNIGRVSREGEDNSDCEDYCTELGS